MQGMGGGRLEGGRLEGGGWRGGDWREEAEVEEAEGNAYCRVRGAERAESWAAPQGMAPRT